jgi:hypothetical protein
MTIEHLTTWTDLGRARRLRPPVIWKQVCLQEGWTPFASSGGRTRGPGSKSARRSSLGAAAPSIRRSAGRGANYEPQPGVPGTLVAIAGPWCVLKHAHYEFDIYINEKSLVAGIPRMPRTLSAALCHFERMIRARFENPAHLNKRRPVRAALVRRPAAQVARPKDHCAVFGPGSKRGRAAFCEAPYGRFRQRSWSPV